MKARTIYSMFLALMALGILSSGIGRAAISPISEPEAISFPAIDLPLEALTFPDEGFAQIALRVQLGIATLPELRYFYRAAERYAPFQGVPAPDWYPAALAAAEALDPQGETKTAANGVIYDWLPLGPTGNFDVTGIYANPGSKNQGRATAVWTHLQGTTVVNKKVIFLGFADGGVWKTLDGGLTWAPLTDFLALSIGAIDVLPGSDVASYKDATVLVGTGEGNFSQPDKDGIGVLKSTDGGKSWSVQPLPFRGDAIGVPGQHRIRRLLIDRNVPNAQSVWVAGDGGVYHTSDGGATWSLVTGLPYSGAPEGAPYPGGCWTEYATDFAINSADLVGGKSVLIAAFGVYRDNACASTGSDARKNNGVYRSVDGGVTWTKIGASGANGFPTVSGLAPPGDVGRITLLAAPSKPKHVYALIARANTPPAADDFQVLGIFSTTDATAATVTWTAGATTNFANAQGWYDLTGAVSPLDDNKLIVGGLDNYRSVDGGATITSISTWSAGDASWAHADHHHAVWVDASTYYDANDGGLSIGILTDGGATWTHANVGALSTLQFYGVGQSATDPYKINAGLQDNGHALLSGGAWRATFGGDGGFAAVNQTNDQEAFEEYVFGAIRNSDNGGLTWPATGCMQTFGTAAPPCTPACQVGVACNPDGHTAFIAHFILDARNQDVMYVGTNVLYRNGNAGGAGKVWTKITSDGAAGDFVGGSSAGSAYISRIHTPPASPVTSGLSQIIYVGTSTGRVWRTTNGGTSWSDLTKPPLPANSATTGRFVSWIDTDPADANRVVVVYSGFNTSTVPAIPGHVFRSLDGGSSWTDISGALPDVPFTAVAVNPNAGETGEIYAGSDVGVFVNTSGWSGTTWTRVNSGLLPHVSVNMLEYTSATNPKRLRAATHGRGIWELAKVTQPFLSFDRPTYTCAETVTVAFQDSLLAGGGTRVAQISSIAEPTPETLTLVETPDGSGHFAAAIDLSGAAAVAGDGRLAVRNADLLRATSGGLIATAITDCSVCGTPPSVAPGANLSLDAAQATLAIQGGDSDEFLDNCENATVTFPIRNTGAGALTNVRIVNAIPSNPSVRLLSLPGVAASLAQCGSISATFTLRAEGLAPREALKFHLDVTSDELAALGILRSADLVFGASEQDFQLQASRTWSFETDLEGWQVVHGVFDRTNANGGGANLTSYYLASSSLIDSACDNARSPVVKLTATSTLSLYNQFSTEPMSQQWYDRANVGIYDLATGQRAPVVPSGGRPYLASGPSGTCGTGGQPGFAGPGPGWLQSSWTAGDLQASALAGKKVQFDVAYGTDASVSGLGFQFDEVTLTNFFLAVGDTQSNVCPALPACMAGTGSQCFSSLTPCRVLDTRLPGDGPALTSGTVRSVSLVGRCGIPATARAVSLNATVVQPTASGSLRLAAPDPTLLPAELYFRSGQTRVNNAVLSLNAAGALQALANMSGGATVQLIIDVNGYFE